MTASIQQMADRVAELMQSRMRVRGRDLTDKVRRAGKRLPKKVRTAAEVLALSAQAARVPKNYQRVDPEVAAMAYDICLRHLKPMDGAKRRRALFADIGLSTGFALVATGALVIGLLIWRGIL